MTNSNSSQHQSIFSQIRDQYDGLPRSGKWLVWFVVLILVYFLVIDRGLTLMDAYRDDIAVATRRISDYGPDKSAELTIREGRVLWGNVRVPADNQVHQASAEIRKILDHYHVTTGVSITENSASPVSITTQGPNGPTTTPMYQAGPIDTRFTARPDIACKVIADIEKSDIITLIKSVRIRRLPDQTALDVNIRTESWYQNPNQGGPQP